MLREQQLFQARARGCLQPAPLVDRHQHRRLCAALGHYLRALGQASFEEFAEPRLRVLNCPDSHGETPAD
jgi:hypothetical protein